MQLYHHHDLPTSHQLWTGHSSSEIGFFSFRSVDLGGFRDLEIEIVSKETFLRETTWKKRVLQRILMRPAYAKSHHKCTRQ